MSTRCTTHFRHRGVTNAIVYRHYDGYPDGHGCDLLKFLSDVKTECSDNTRLGDPTYLAAKLVVWLARKTGNVSRPMNFSGIGVYMSDPGDIDYRYYVDCKNDDELPQVNCFRVKPNDKPWGDPERALIDTEKCDIPSSEEVSSARTE